MTIKQLLAESIKKEIPAFVKVLEAIPEDKGDYTPNPSSRTTQSIAAQLAVQGNAISDIVKKGVLGGESAGLEGIKIKDCPELARKNFEQAIKDLQDESDEDFENEDARMVLNGKEVWKDKKYKMAWDMLFDAIHHRGQLSSYLRPMGGKVPGIYGPSGDDTGGM